MSFFKHDSNMKASVGLAGMMICLIIFFIALFNQEKLMGQSLLVFPFSLLLGLFSFGFFRTGTIIRAIKDMLLIVFLIIGFVSLIKLSSFIIFK